METIFNGLNNAYILFSFVLGFYALSFPARNMPISGNFWGTLWTNTGLAAAIFIVALIMTLQGLLPVQLQADGSYRERKIYYLYAVYFIISLPGLFTLLQGNDKGRAGIWFGCVAIFNGLAAYRAGYGLVSAWE